MRDMVLDARSILTSFGALARTPPKYGLPESSTHSAAPASRVSIQTLWTLTNRSRGSSPSRHALVCMSG